LLLDRFRARTFLGKGPRGLWRVGPACCGNGRLARVRGTDGELCSMWTQKEERGLSSGRLEACWEAGEPVGLELEL
jgi:hypothetical protein